jgi:hypothetical protein
MLHLLLEMQLGLLVGKHLRLRASPLRSHFEEVGA